MLQSCYYRCPIPIEDMDREHPRFFVLAQLWEYNELSDTATVVMHDLLDSGRYYGELLKHTTFPARALQRCAAVPGGTVRGAWGRGRVVCRVEPAMENQPYHYWIKLEDGCHVQACETELEIEYSQMDHSPAEQLRSYEFQHPTWFLNRLKVSRNLHLINNAAYGFEVLAGCRVFLLPHQVSTVARCLETLPVRYMLADEVGLGKTVEACSILKILRSENSRLRTLIVAPGALVAQWGSELKYKYNLTAALSAAGEEICLLPMEELEGAEDILAAPWDLLMVDETHRLLGRDGWYRRVQELSRETQHLLLLSATPIQDRNEEYRQLLALLNPAQYQSMTPERFGWLVAKQKSVQQAVRPQLGRLDHYEDYVDIILEKLGEIADSLEDATLRALVEEISPAAQDGGKAMAVRALAYVCENYRLERKVVRNRRQLIAKEMARRTLEEISYRPLSADEGYNEIGTMQAVLSHLTQHGDGTAEYIAQTAIPLLGAVFSSPWAIEETLEALGIDDAGLWDSAANWKMQAQLEHRQVDYLLDEDPDQIKGRMMHVMNYLDQETDILSDPECKIVAFTGHNATLREFARLFNARFEPQGVFCVVFGQHMERDQLEDSVYAFQNHPDCRLIACDETGGEGRNFQNADLVIHLDLPWNANVLEQRIGRLDRLGRDPNLDVQSVVVYAETSVEEQLMRIWRDSMKLFEQSLSGLEIVTGELNGLIAQALGDDFYNGLANALEDIVEQADTMRESVEDEQLFDIGAMLYRPLSRGIDQVLHQYAREEDNLFAQAMLGWGEQAGLVPEREQAGGLVEFKESRFSVRSAIQSIFIPPDWGSYSDSAMMRREGKILGSFDRVLAAVREDILFFAPGDPVYDAIIRNAASCSRGRCAAMQARGPFQYDGVLYIYHVEPDINALLQQADGQQLLAQFRMFLPLKPIVIPIPLTGDARKVEESRLLEFFHHLTHRDVEHLGRRGSARLTESPLERFMARNPPGEWEPLVDKCTTQARQRALLQMREQSDMASAKKEIERIVNGHYAQALYFESGPEVVQAKAAGYDAAMKALEASEPVLDSVCFLRVR